MTGDDDAVLYYEERGLINIDASQKESFLVIPTLARNFHSKKNRVDK